MQSDFLLLGCVYDPEKAALTVLSEVKELMRGLPLDSFSSVTGLSYCSLFPAI